ncbi:MAG: GHKL domain-containing protein [Clostridium argentinense]|uniref:GHKL domain-containing protein n=1 Tax=Clostridium faecium TaxID=2762223 RepID=A0ABR8YNN8_9CLOT|nr:MULTISPECIES: sensor histidine kinase [Clostridium]MBD8045869.1 GHKL domain-containing protein [Clostridium faecium]MBS5824178.1 GHKL domain-containing protein [Clostridium argentinense]MDU1350247.1 GHKL domain-containing protein [Clostridium argentinense]
MDIVVISNVFIKVVEVILGYLFMKAMFDKNNRPNHVVVILLICQVVVTYLSNTYFGLGSQKGILFIIFCNVVTYKYIFNSDLLKIIFGNLAYIIVITFIELIFVSFTYMLFGINQNQLVSSNLYTVIYFTLTRTIVYLMIRFAGNIKIVQKNLKKVYVYELIMTLSINIFFIFMIFSLFKNKDVVEASSSTIFIMTITIIIFTGMVINIVNQIIKYSKKESEWLLLMREYERQQNYIENLDRLTYKLKAQRHDFNHHISCIYGLLELDNMDEAKKYAKELLKDVQEVNNIINIENSTILAILNNNLTVAKEKDIEVDLNIDIPKELKVNSMDISIILGNSLTNAIEACEGLRKKYIKLYMYMKGEYLIIKIKNSKKTDVFIDENSYETTKIDKENHGFGLKNIKYIVDKYDGLLKIEQSKEEFVLNIAMKENG